MVAERGQRAMPLTRAATFYYGGRQSRIQVAANVECRRPPLYTMAAANIEYRRPPFFKVDSHICYDSRDKYLTQTARYDARVTTIPCNLSNFLQKPSYL